MNAQEIIQYIAHGRKKDACETLYQSPKRAGRLRLREGLRRRAIKIVFGDWRELGPILAANREQDRRRRD